MITTNQALITILAMGLATYLTRAGGYFLAGRLDHLPGFVKSLLGYIPGTIIIAIIAPQIMDGGPATQTGALVCLAAALLMKNMVGVMVVGVAYVALFRHFFGG
ncbi:MAG: AzlD domain-containing protein [Desulfobacterales bacterium]|nr:AzlD domain-containing protein [Desulfobacterales bacterium]